MRQTLSMRNIPRQGLEIHDKGTDADTCGLATLMRARHVALFCSGGDLDATIAMLDSEQAEAGHPRCSRLQRVVNCSCGFCGKLQILHLKATSSAAPARTATSGASASSAPPAASHQSDNGTDGSALSTLLQMGYEKRQAMCLGCGHLIILCSA